MNLGKNGAVVSVGHSLRTVDGSDYTSWQHILFLKHLWTNTSSRQPSFPTQKVLVILLPSYFTVSKMSKNIIENTCYKQKLETNNKRPSNGKMNEPTMMYPYNEILLSNKRNKLLTKATTMDESQMPYAL